MNRYLFPLIGFSVIAIFLAIGLGLNPREIPSPFINKPAPAFAIPSLDQNEASVTDKDFSGQVWLFNIWASWCVACLEEHPLLMRLAKTNAVNIVGLNYKDSRRDAIAWLGKWGNPYHLIAYDASGDVGIDYGVYGVPETFVIDKGGVIRLKHIGPLTTEVLNDTVVPLITQLQQEQA